MHVCGVVSVASVDVVKVLTHPLVLVFEVGVNGPIAAERARARVGGNLISARRHAALDHTCRPHRSRPTYLICQRVAPRPRQIHTHNNYHCCCSTKSSCCCVSTSCWCSFMAAWMLLKPVSPWLAAICAASAARLPWLLVASWLGEAAGVFVGGAALSSGHRSGLCLGARARV